MFYFVFPDVFADVGRDEENKTMFPGIIFCVATSCLSDRFIKAMLQAC